MKNTMPSIRVGWLIRYLLMHRVSAQAIEAHLQLAQGTDLTRIKCLPILTYFKLFNWGSEVLADPYLGLNICPHIQEDDFGYAMLVAHHSSTLREAIESVQQFDALISQGLNIGFEEGPETCSVSYGVIIPTEQSTRHDVELSLALIMAMLRENLGSGWHPLRVDFTHAQPEGKHRYQQEFCEHVYFNQAHNRITFSSRYLDTKISSADPVMHKRVRAILEQMKNEVLKEESLLTRVRYYISISLGTSHSSCDWVAQCSNMSRRSLARHLKTLGTSFRELKEIVTMEMARSLLLENRFNVSAISLELGYAEVAAFTRAFKKSTGLTPKEYRRQAL